MTLVNDLVKLMGPVKAANRSLSLRQRRSHLKTELRKGNESGGGGGNRNTTATRKHEVSSAGLRWSALPCYQHPAPRLMGFCSPRPGGGCQLGGMSQAHRFNSLDIKLSVRYKGELQSRLTEAT